MDKNIKKYVYTPIIFIILGVCVLSLPYYYQCKAYLSYDKPSMEFAYRNSAIGVSILPSTRAEMLRDRAMWFYVNGQRENCIADLIKIESMKQAIEDDYALLSNCYISKKDWTRALEYAQKQGKKLVLSLGYSHPVEMEDPEGIETVLDGTNIIIVKGISKEAVGQYAAEIRAKRAPEPYKGKGIKYADEVIRRKVDKTGKK